MNIEDVKFLEIHVHLLVRPDGMTREELTTALWPGLDEAEAGALLDETVQVVNTVARAGNNCPTLTMISVREGRYRIDVQEVDEHVMRYRALRYRALMS